MRSTVYAGTGSTQVRYAGANYAGTGSMTIEAWVYRENASRCETILSQGFTQSFWFGFCGGSLRFYRAGGVFLDAGVNVPAHRWTHVAVRYVGGILERAYFYIDGELITSGLLAPPTSASTAQLYIGSDPAGFPFRGALDEVRLWSVARSATQIRDNRFREITSGSGLTAVFSEGGLRNAVNGATPVHAAGVTEQIEGILPRNLVLPQVPLNISVNGNLPPEIEAGAERMVLRYWNGTREIDTVAYLAFYRRSVSPASYALYVAVRDWESIGGVENLVRFTWGLDTEGRALVGSEDFRTTFAWSTGNFSFSQGNPTFGTFAGASQGSSEAAMDFCRGEFLPPCLEMTSRSLSFSEIANAGLMLHVETWASVSHSGSTVRPAPFDADPFNPSTWPRVTQGGLIGQSVGHVARVRVLESFYDEASPVLVAPYVLKASNAQTTEALGSTTVTLGSYINELAALQFHSFPNTSVFVEIQPAPSWEILDKRALPGPHQPTSFVGNGAVYPADTGENRTLATLEFDVRAVPAAAFSPAGFTPDEGSRSVVVRTDPVKIAEGDFLEITGANLHARTRVYLTTCTAPPLSHYVNPWDGPCSESQFHLLPQPEVRSDRTRLRVPLVSGTAPNAPLRVLVENLAPSDVSPRWTLLEGTFLLMPQPYPKLHGFEFVNVRDGTQFDAFSSVYQRNAYDCLTPVGPFPHVETCIGCRVPNALYVSFLSFVYNPWANLMTGSCLGMAATSLQMARGELTPGQFQAGAVYAYGLSGLPDPENPDGTPLAPKPQQYNFRVCDYSEPVNLWAHIHTNQVSQISSEIITEVLSQMSGNGLFDADSIAADPNDALTRLAASPLNYVLSFQNSGDLMAMHAVVPYRLEEETGLDESGYGREPKPGHTLIHIYENNDPGRPRYIEIDRAANTYRYRFGNRRVDEETVEPWWWSGQGIYLLPASLFQQAKTMPGMSELFDGLALLLMGGASAVYEDESGGRYGWDDAGNFTETYAGAKVIAPLSQALPGGVFDPPPEPPPVFFFPPADNPPETIRVHPRGGDYTFHASGHGTLALLHLGARNPGGLDEIRLTEANGLLRGFTFTAAESLSNITPFIGFQREEAAPLLVEWSGLSLPPGGTVGFETDPLRDAVRFRNISGRDSLVHLRVHHSGEQGPLLTEFGPVITLPGATQTFVLDELGDTVFATMEIDLTGDGQADIITPLDPDSGRPEEAPPVLRIEKTDTGAARLTWRLGASPWFPEMSTELSPGADWTPLENVTPFFDGPDMGFELPLDGKPVFIRLRRIGD